MDSKSAPHRAPLTVRSGHSSLQGVRPSMEDEVLIKESFRLSQSTAALSGPLSFYGVFDGHGGRQAAIYTRDHLFTFLVQALEKGTAPEEALRSAFLETDNTFIAACRGEEKEAEGATDKEEHIEKEKDKPSTATSPTTIPPPINTSLPLPSSSASASSSSLDKGDTSGTTAVAILICHGTHTLYIAHVGDSRAILLSTSTSPSTVLSLTSDHKADRPDEVERIRAAGGFVVHKRVMGELAVSRAIGDVDFKKQSSLPVFDFVIADPEVSMRELREEEDVLVMACDGLYDVMTNEKVAEYVREGFKERKGEQELAEAIVHHAIDKLFTRDNVTVIIIHFVKGERSGGEGEAPAVEPSLAHHAPHAQHGGGHAGGHHAGAHHHHHHHAHHHHHHAQEGHGVAATAPVGLAPGGEVAQARPVPPATMVAAGDEPVAEVVMQDAPHP